MLLVCEWNTNVALDTPQAKRNSYSSLASLAELEQLRRIE